MRITMFAHGSRGDVWPMVALGTTLTERGHVVTLATSREYQALVQGSGLIYRPLPVDLIAYAGSPEGQHLLTCSRFTFLRTIQRAFDPHADEFDDAFRSAAQGAEAIVTNQVIWDRSQTTADALRIPMAVVYAQPMTATREYPASTLCTSRPRSGTLRLASHHVALQVWWRGNAKAVRSMRRKLGLPAKVAPTYRRLRHPGALGLSTLSPSLLPRPVDWPASMKSTGAWTMPASVRTSLGEGLPAELEVWLKEGDPPVFMGFGSMPVLDPAPLFADILAVTAKLGVRAVIDAAWAGQLSAAIPDRVRFVGPSDHDRLFPLCAAVVHHGGAGSTTASTRAGAPTMVCSVLCDQPFWGEHLKRLGVGTHVPFRKLNRERLEAGLRTLLSPEVRTRARALGEAIRAEGDGLPAAAQLLDDWLVTAEPTP